MYPFLIESDATSIRHATLAPLNLTSYEAAQTAPSWFVTVLKTNGLVLEEVVDGIVKCLAARYPSTFIQSVTMGLSQDHVWKVKHQYLHGLFIQSLILPAQGSTYTKFQ